MADLITQFCILALRYPDFNIERLYNRFILKLTDEEQTFAIENFMLFIKTAEAARDAIPEIKEKICKT